MFSADNRAFYESERRPAVGGWSEPQSAPPVRASARGRPPFGLLLPGMLAVGVLIAALGDRLDKAGVRDLLAREGGDGQDDRANHSAED